MEIFAVELPLKNKELSVRSNRSPFAPNINGVVSALASRLLDTSSETSLVVIGRPSVKVSAPISIVDLTLW